MSDIKITATEAKKILNAAGFDFKTWGWGGYLNFIIGFAYGAAKDYDAKGEHDMAVEYKRRAGLIFDALEERGFYTV